MEKYEWSRRTFITTMTGAGAVILLNPFFSWAADEIDPRVAAIVSRTMGIDAHNHIDVRLGGTNLSGPAVNLMGEMRKSGLSAICMTFAVDYQQLRNPGEAYQRFINGLNAMDKVLTDNDMKRALNLADLRAAHNNHKPIVIQSVEGAHFLEGRLERLTEAYSGGLRLLTLLHDTDASVPLGDVFTNPPKWSGLTPFGLDVIKECNRLGILVDLSHASNETMNAALRLSAHPVIVSHTGLDTQLGKDEFMNKMMRPRLISKNQAQAVAETGGVIGVWTHLSDTPLEYAQNIRAMVEVAGIDHVCIGTDTKLTPPYNPSRMPANAPKMTRDDQASQEGDVPKDQENPKDPANNKNGNSMGERTNEAWKDPKAGFYYTVVDAMLQAGFTEEEIEKIGGGNFCRIFNEATARH